MLQVYKALVLSMSLEEKPAEMGGEVPAPCYSAGCLAIDPIGVCRSLSSRWVTSSASARPDLFFLFSKWWEHSHLFFVEKLCEVAVGAMKNLLNQHSARVFLAHALELSPGARGGGWLIYIYIYI